MTTWAFVEAALQKEYERAAYPEAMFPQVRDEISASRSALLSAIKTVRFAAQSGQALPSAAEVAKCSTPERKTTP